MRDKKTTWRELTHTEKMKYAIAMRRLNLGYWGYPVSSLRAVHLTTREGNDNTTKVFAHDLRKLVLEFREQGYALQYDGTLEYSPGKGLLHWHGLFRIKDGYFLCPVKQTEKKGRRIVGDLWNKCHGAFVVQIKPVKNNKELREYILKHMMKEYIGEDEAIRNKFLFSKGWMREGWKDVEELAKLWTLGGLESDGGLSMMYMNKEKWNLVNKIMQAWAEKRKQMFLGQFLDGVSGDRTGHLFMELGRIREVIGSAFLIQFEERGAMVTRRSTYEYLDY